MKKEISICDNCKRQLEQGEWPLRVRHYVGSLRIESYPFETEVHIVFKKRVARNQAWPLGYSSDENLALCYVCAEDISTKLKASKVTWIED